MTMKCRRRREGLEGDEKELEKTLIIMQMQRKWSSGPHGTGGAMLERERWWRFKIIGKRERRGNIACVEVGETGW